MKNSVSPYCFLLFMAVVFLMMGSPQRLQADEIQKPNIIMIFCDNLGYGDVGCFGSEKIKTPNLDQMAREGKRFTSFCVSSGVCTPSRASLMTGCYAQRVRMHQSSTGASVLKPMDHKGLHPDEVTIAEVLKEAGYKTACYGKWHLGDQPEFLPTRQGFDEFFGVPYSDDMTAEVGKKFNWPELPLLENEKVIEAPVDRNYLTKRYTERSIRFITENREQPFFLYIPQAMPGSTGHPFASEAFRGKSDAGSWGDSVEELDWSTGEILKALKRLNLDSRTLVIWTSDNGAPRHKEQQGSNGPLRGWGYSTWEGGMRVPCIMRWPGQIPAGTQTNELCTTMDMLPTFAKLAGATLPSEKIIDGQNILELITSSKPVKSPHEVFYYYQMQTLRAVRSGKWKLHLPLPNPSKSKRRNPRGSVDLMLVDLEADVGETTNLAESRPEVVKKLLAYAEVAREKLGDSDRKGSEQREAGWVENPVPLLLSQE